MFDFCMHIPALAKVGAAFGAMLLSYRLGLGLGYAIILATAGLTLWTGVGAEGFAWLLAALAAPESLLLLAVILLLLFFTESLDKTGRMSRTVASLKAWLSSHSLLLAGLPALVGLLPMPGGALFSAPLVASVDSDQRLAPAHKVAINYWFRHIWEVWWPLYPGVILAIRYSGLAVGTFMAVMAPLTVASVLGGYLFILRKAPRPARVEARGALRGRDAAATLVPIGVLVTIAIGASAALPAAGVDKNIANLLAIIAGLAAALCLTFFGHAGAIRGALGMFAARRTWSLVLVLIGVQLFSATLRMPVEADRTLIALIRDDFMRFGIPVVPIILLRPCIAGAVTGIAFGFVGASFPLVFALLGPQPPTNQVIATTVLAYGAGYAGMLLSPVHICFVVTNEYFKTRLFHAYPWIIGPVATLLASALALGGLYYLAF
jgi:hypothetical protein